MPIPVKPRWFIAAMLGIYTQITLATSLFGKTTGSLVGSAFGIPGTNATYDYVIVGGGTAGLTIASRLNEQKAGSVAVVEAGTFYELSNGNHSQIPGTASYYVGKDPNDWQPLVDWGYVTTPQAGGYNVSMHYARGKMLGGCSGRHFMMYQRPSKGSQQMWADAVGDESYTFDNFLPFFEKSLNFTPPNTSSRLANATFQYDDSALGTGDGPLSLTYPNYVYSFATWATEALKDIGIPIRDGFQNGDILGQSYVPLTIQADTMLRESSATAFLGNSLDDPNYTLYPLTMGKKVVFSGNRSSTATGVLVDTQGKEYFLSARKEVIISGGFIGSPQLLQVSGIGPADVLDSLGITVIADRPGVGQNLQDHVIFGLTHRVSGVTASAFQNAQLSAAQAALFDDSAKGMLTSPGIDVMAFEKLPSSVRSNLSNSTQGILNTDYPEDWPEVEYISLAAYLGSGYEVATADPDDGSNYATLSAVLVSPRSRGSVTISSPDTSVAPNIDPALLTDEADVEIGVAAFKRARQFWNSTSMRQFSDTEEAFPGDDVQTDAQIVDSLRKNFNTIWHGSCTCAMGKANDSLAVVDSQARVIGVQGLRVVDASAFPFLPPGHPQSVVYALAEKIACDISGNC